MASPQSIQPATICRERVAQIQRKADAAECQLVSGRRLLLTRLLADHVSPNDEISFPLLIASLNAGTEIYVSKNSLRGNATDLYQAPIGYVTQPKKDKRDQFFVAAEVRQGRLGISSIMLPCEALREYFYRILRNAADAKPQTLYKILRISSTASPAELRVAFKLRGLELQAQNAPHSEHVTLERAFNVIGEPELRACYDALLTDPEAPAGFPYGGFGSLLMTGERSRDGNTFFANRILAFVPECRERRFHALLRKCNFYDDRALYRDVRRKLELWLDPAILHKTWDATWNQWKHLLETKMEVRATFVRCGKYQRRRAQWELVTSETALPSRIAVKLPTDFHEQVESAKRRFQRFGRYSASLDKIRQRIEYAAVERGELERMLAALNVPGDFDVAEISWRPDYDPSFYHQLSRRARHLYLLRDEYIFDLKNAVVIETPQLGHATYIFSKPRNMESFLGRYARLTKDDIRHNRNNSAAELGFVGRVIHGSNPRQWIKELRQLIGEKMDYEAAAAWIRTLP